MIQEVQVTLTLAVNAKLSKKDIQRHIERLVNYYSGYNSTYFKMLVKQIDIKEESEIYDNK